MSQDSHTDDELPTSRLALGYANGSGSVRSDTQSTLANDVLQVRAIRETDADRRHREQFQETAVLADPLLLKQI